jgi:hypothetical protein
MCWLSLPVYLSLQDADFVRALISKEVGDVETSVLKFIAFLSQRKVKICVLDKAAVDDFTLWSVLRANTEE